LAANPEEYAAGKMNTWKIVNIVSFSISAVFVLIFIYMKVTGKDVEMQEYYMKMLEEMQKGR